MYRSTKTYSHDVGLSCCYRQWRATSHCNKLHGYAIAVHFEFEALELDHRNWVVDFGGLKLVKRMLENLLDHKTLVAKDDPLLPHYNDMAKLGMLNLVVLPAVGCEALAHHIFMQVSGMVNDERVRLCRVEVREHGANSAIYGD